MRRLRYEFRDYLPGPSLLVVLALAAAVPGFCAYGQELGESSVAPAVPLPPPARSQQLELASREADGHTRRAFQLAERGAYLSARAELIAALRLVAQALDAEDLAGVHSQALAAGLWAMKEADDFVPAPGQLEADLSLPVVIRGHRSPVLKDASLDRLTAVMARQSYLTFAQQQLAVSAGSETSGSMALYGLGKLHAAIAQEPSTLLRQPVAKAVAFYQAALLVDPSNYMAANELGVLLARSGRYQEARAALEHSIAARRTAIGWRNLATVYRALGLTDRADCAERLARREAQSEEPRAIETPAGPVQWVPAETFAGHAPAPGTAPAATEPASLVPGSAPGKPVREGSPAPQVAGKSFWSSLLGRQ